VPLERTGLSIIARELVFVAYPQRFIPVLKDVDNTVRPDGVGIFWIEPVGLEGSLFGVKAAEPGTVRTYPQDAPGILENGSGLTAQRKRGMIRNILFIVSFPCGRGGRWISSPSTRESPDPARPGRINHNGIFPIA
jgi:hypothetical protein